MAEPTQQQIIDGLVQPGVRWSGALITFSIPVAGSVWVGYGGGTEPVRPGYSVLTATEAAGFRSAVDAWAKLIAMPVRETDDRTETGDIRVAFAGPPSGHSFYPPGPGGVPPYAGDIWLDAPSMRVSGTAWTPEATGGSSSTPYMILLHELGHALGLKHPHEGAAVLPTDHNSVRYSQMSYNSGIDNVLYTFRADPGSFSGLRRDITIVPVGKPMVYDILAIQSLYGANPITNRGDTVYAWDEGQGFFDSIYDAGGSDTFDLSSHHRGSIVDLTPGAYSSIAKFTLAQQAAYWGAQFTTTAWAIAADYADPGFQAIGYTWTDNVGIAFNTVIENVRAGSGDDTITGNAAANQLSGGGGADRIFGGAGDDTVAGEEGESYLRGEDGNDSLSGGSDFDDIQGNIGNDTEHGLGGRDWVVGGKDNDLLFGDDGDDVMNGNLGGDTVDGGNGADWVRGGQGSDSIVGQAGNDWLSGDLGDDTISGGAGGDTFHGFVGIGVDRITDFNAAEGDRILLDPGTAYTVLQAGADTVVNITGGGQMVLVGVSFSSLDSGWISAG